MATAAALEGGSAVTRLTSLVHSADRYDIPTADLLRSKSRQVRRARIASAGGQRVVPLGSTWMHILGGSHDGMFALQQLVPRMSDQHV